MYLIEYIKEVNGCEFRPFDLANAVIRKNHSTTSKNQYEYVRKKLANSTLRGIENTPKCIMLIPLLWSN